MVEMSKSVLNRAAMLPLELVGGSRVAIFLRLG
jgi:hypothetical protein